MCAEVVSLAVPNSLTELLWVLTEQSSLIPQLKERVRNSL